jgi:hypothetical protein
MTENARGTRKLMIVALARKQAQDALAWLLSNPEGPSQGEQAQDLLNSLHSASDPQFPGA